jgi:hypothetical protein
MFDGRLPAGLCSDDPGFKSLVLPFATSGVTNKVISSASAVCLSSATMIKLLKLLLANHSNIKSFILTLTF